MKNEQKKGALINKISDVYTAFLTFQGKLMKQ